MMGTRIFEIGRLRPFARKLVHRVRRMRGFLVMRLGQVGSSRPLSYVSGFDRGTPIDRYYIERFLAEHACDVKGRVLEIGDDVYSRRFGGSRITKQDILHIDKSNPKATIIGDLGNIGLLPTHGFDCIIFTQTLQYVFNLSAAVEQLRKALRPGGVLLMTAPGIAPISGDQWGESFYWRFTEPSLRGLLASAFDAQSTEVLPFGNLYAATAFLHGASVQEVSKKKLEPVSPGYAIVIAARAVA